MTDKRTLDGILDNLEEWVTNRIPIGPHLWLEAAQMLTVLVGDVQEELFLTDQALAKKKLEFIEAGDKVNKAEVKIETLDEFVKARMLTAKIDRITELVRISKIQARMSTENLQNN